jgi:hypothetical protein
MKMTSYYKLIRLEDFDPKSMVWTGILTPWLRMMHLKIDQ